MTGPTRMVGALLFDGERVLLGHRSATRAEHAGVWDVVGGHVEAGEGLVDALRRELREELGIDVGTPPASWRLVRDGSGSIDLTVWLLVDWVGTVTNAAPDEHSELRWFRRDELGDLAFPHPLYPELLAAAFDAAAVVHRDGGGRVASDRRGA